MCQNNGVIVGLFIIKLIAFLVMPSVLIYFKIRKFENYEKIVNIEIVLILFLITITIIGGECIVNSSFARIGNLSLNNKEDYSIIRDSNGPDTIESVQSSDAYLGNQNQKVYYFNNNKLPLSRKSINCNNKKIYMKHFGNNITAISMLLSTELKQNIDPISLLNLSIENEIFDCDNGVDTNELLYLVSKKYNVSVRSIPKEEALIRINTGNIVMAETHFNMYSNNVSCEKSNIILYKINNEGKYNILNPNDSDFDYICPENTSGYGAVIKANSNNSEWLESDINSIVSKYIVIER